MHGVARGLKLEDVRGGLLAIQRRLIDDERSRTIVAVGVSPRQIRLTGVSGGVKPSQL